MSRPYQVVPSFSSVYLVADQLMLVTWSPILFNIIETDGTDPKIYDSTTGEFTAPTSGWYDIIVNLQTSAPLSGIRIVQNGDTNFPPIARVPITTNASLYLRIQLGLGETVRVEAIGAVSVLATAGTVPNARASNVVFTMVKRFEDTRVF